MKRWLETQGYLMVWRLAGYRWPGARWLHDTWAEFWYRHYCPYPTHGNWTARSCVMSCNCSCENLDRYANPPPPQGKAGARSPLPPAQGNTP
jgi:hypothetical protein